MSKAPETFAEDEAPIPLATLGDVQRALARVIRQTKKGTVELATAHCMVIALGTLAKLMQDQRDSLWTKRAKKLWDEREARTQPTAETDH